MFSSLKEKLGFGKKGEVIGAPVQGQAVALSEVSDPTFAEEMLGKGMAIIPSVGKVVAPVDATVDMVFDTKHAVALSTASGIQILIHVGLDTVSLNGAPFTTHVEAGQAVKAGDLLLEVDLEAIKAAGLETITPVIICNTPDYKEIKASVGKNVNTLDEVLTLVK